MTVAYNDDTAFTGDAHSILEISTAIRHKQYGKDVREAIAQQGETLYAAIMSLGENLNISVTPTDTLDSSAELVSKYPKGVEGIFVTSDTGHWWFWSSTAEQWKDGGPYQSSGTDYSKSIGNRLAGYVVPLSSSTITAKSNTDLSIEFDMPSKFLVSFIDGNGVLELKSYDVLQSQSQITVQNGEYLLFDSSAMAFKNVTQGTINTLTSGYILLGYNSYGYFKGQWGIYQPTLENLSYIKNLRVFPSGNTTIKIDPKTLAATVSLPTDLYYQQLDTKTLGTFKNGSDPVSVPSLSYLIFDLSDKTLKVLSENQFASDNNPLILLLYNYRGYLRGDWSKYYADDSIIPRYYHIDNYIEDKIYQIKANTSVDGGDSFVYITDTHYGDNAHQSKALVDYVLDQTTIKNVVFGGDIVRAYGSQTDALNDTYEYLDFVKSINNDGHCYGVKGNHDITIKTSASVDTGWTARQSVIYNYLNRQNESVVSGSNNKSYYFFDNSIQKIRYIVLDQYEDVEAGGTYWGTKSAFTQDQLDWLTKTALDVDGYTLVIFTHSPSDPVMKYYSPYLDVVQKMLIAINNKQHFTYNDTDTGLSTDIDFTNTNNYVACHFSGHAHIDYSNVDNKVLSVGFLCDAAYNDDPQYASTPRTKGTINEQAFDVVSIDTVNRTIKLVRIGQGNDRSFTY